MVKILVLASCAYKVAIYYVLKVARNERKRKQTVDWGMYSQKMYLEQQLADTANACGIPKNNGDATVWNCQELHGLREERRQCSNAVERSKIRN